MDYVNAIVDVINDLKSWALGLVGVITIFMITVYSIKYLMGNASEKSEAISNLKKTLIMGGGIFFLIWFADTVITKFSGIGD